MIPIRLTSTIFCLLTKKTMENHKQMKIWTVKTFRKITSIKSPNFRQNTFKKKFIFYFLNTFICIYRTNRAKFREGIIRSLVSSSGNFEEATNFLMNLNILCMNLIIVSKKIKKKNCWWTLFTPSINFFQKLYVLLFIKYNRLIFSVLSRKSQMIVYSL